MRYIILITLFLFFVDHLSGKTLIVNLENFRNNQGLTALLLFKEPDGFPIKPDLALKGGSSVIKDRRAQFIFTDLALGTYAVAAIHDENGNGKLDFNFIGIPKEATAASNGAKGMFGPPSYKDAAFELSMAEHSITLNFEN